MKPSAMSTGRVTAVVAALWLAACGGGDDGTTASTAPDAVAGTPGAAAARAPLTAASLTFSAVRGLTANPYQGVATDDTGRVMAAITRTAGGGGQILLSTDGGVRFAPSSAPLAGWVSLDMTPDGTRMVAVASGGGLYRLTDRTFGWTRIDTGFNPAGSLPYESVTLSDDGTRVVAVTLGGSILFSSDADADAATPTFREALLANGGVLTDAFRAVAGSASGDTVVAASGSGRLYLSGDGGATFSLLPVTIGRTAVVDGWYRVAISADGNRIVVAGNTEFGQGLDPAARSTGLYVGNRSDGGWTWTRASTVAGAYTSVAMSRDGGVIGATLSSTTDSTAGEVLLSSDGGASFTRVATPGEETDWRAIALSGDASRAVLAAGTPLQRAGFLYVSPEAGAAASAAPVATPAPTPTPTPSPSPTPVPTRAPSVTTTPAAPALSPLAPTLSPISPVTPTLAPAVSAPAPVVPTLAPAFAPAVPALTPLAPSLAPVAPAAPSLAPLASEPAPVLAPVAPPAPAVAPANGPAGAPGLVTDPFDSTMQLFR